MMHQTKDAKSRDLEKHKQELHNYDERLQNQLQKERDKNTKKMNKDVADVRRHLEEISGHNGELLRANSDLRHKISEMEQQLKERNGKISSYKHYIEHLHKIKKKQEEHIQSLQIVGDQVLELERIKDEYMRKSKEQSRTMQTFMGQIANLQEEIKTMAAAQLDTSLVITQQEEQTGQERRAMDHWKRKYKEARRREQQLEELR